MCYLFCLALILFAYTSCDAQALTQQKNEADMISDISVKVDDLWNLYGSGFNLPNTADNVRYAICTLQPNPNLNASEPNITGQILFKQAYSEGKLEAHFAVQGFPVNPSESLKAIHIHTYGDLSNGCDSAGGHYNPLSVNHPNHPGDFGNFQVLDGQIQQQLTNLPATLYGPFSVLGRSVVVHKLADDLGKGNNQASLENGNAGARLACCVIGITNSANWDKCMADNQ